MQVSARQVQQLSQGQAQGRAQHWQAVADQALPAAQRQDPHARLHVLAQAVAQAQGPKAALLAVDVQQTAQWLALGLKQGAPWREARAVGLLHAAAALGAMWFADGRLLAVPQMLRLQATLDASVAQLLLQAHGQRYKAAAQRERERRPALHLALQRLLAQPDDASAQQAMAAAAFPPPADDELHPPADDAPPPPELEQFLHRERGLCAQAGVADAALARLCAAGDLALGLGRCVRMLALAPALPAERGPWLTEVLHGLARPQP